MPITSITSLSAADTHVHASALNGILTMMKIYMGSIQRCCLKDSAGRSFTFASIFRDEVKKDTAAMDLHYSDTRGHSIPLLDVI